MEIDLAPMTWSKFKRLEKDAQQNYLQQLIDGFGANTGSFADMFRINRSTLHGYISNRGIELTYGSRLDKKRWEEFVSQIDGTDFTGIAGYERLVRMGLPSFSIHLTGEIDVDRIAEVLHKFFDGVKDGEITILGDISSSGDNE